MPVKVLVAANNPTPQRLFLPNLPSLIFFSVCVFSFVNTLKNDCHRPSLNPLTPPSPQQVTFENLMSFMVFHAKILPAGGSPRLCSMITLPHRSAGSALSHAHLEKLYVLLGGLKWSRRLTFPSRRVARVCEKTNPHWLAGGDTQHAWPLPINPRLRYQSISRLHCGGWEGS